MYDVMIMNHDEDVLELMAETLEQSGFAAHVLHTPSCGDIDEIVATISRYNPQLIVYDMGPPPYESQLNTWRELCDKTKEQYPFILTTTNPQIPLRLDPGTCSVRHIFIKPMNLQNLVDAVKNTLRH